VKRPFIGVIPLWDGKKESVWMLPGYLDGVCAAGGLPVILPLTGDTDLLSDLFGRFDGFLFTGGQDVSPALYGEITKSYCGETCEKRDVMEAYLLRRAIEHDKPFFSICRGIQILNAVMGGSLYQDIPSELPSELIHKQKPPYDLPSHDVEISGELAELLKTNRLSVNSYHHQGIKRLAPGLTACAKSDDGLTEAVTVSGKRFALAVQWHPELSLMEESSVRLFGAFIAGSRPV